MKFFLPELGFCFGGTVITPGTDSISADLSTTHRRVTQPKSRKQWRPELTAIEEDGGVLNGGTQVRHESSAVVRSEKKPLNKAGPAGKNRFHSYGGDYRKSTHAMALPAFSPTPFVF